MLYGQGQLPEYLAIDSLTKICLISASVFFSSCAQTVPNAKTKRMAAENLMPLFMVLFLVPIV